jgi:hypothetical protein
MFALGRKRASFFQPFNSIWISEATLKDGLQIEIQIELKNALYGPNMEPVRDKSRQEGRWGKYSLSMTKSSWRIL